MWNASLCTLALGREEGGKEGMRGGREVKSFPGSGGYLKLRTLNKSSEILLCVGVFLFFSRGRVGNLINIQFASP